MYVRIFCKPVRSPDLSAHICENGYVVQASHWFDFQTPSDHPLNVQVRLSPQQRSSNYGPWVQEEDFVTLSDDEVSQGPERPLEPLNFDQCPRDDFVELSQQLERHFEWVETFIQ